MAREAEGRSAIEIRTDRVTTHTVAVLLAVSWFIAAVEKVSVHHWT